jgi:hypothetical protein
MKATATTINNIGIYFYDMTFLRQTYLDTMQPMCNSGTIKGFIVESTPDSLLSEDAFLELIDETSLRSRSTLSTNSQLI